MHNHFAMIWHGLSGRSIYASSEAHDSAPHGKAGAPHAVHAFCFPHSVPAHASSALNITHPVLVFLRTSCYLMQVGMLCRQSNQRSSSCPMRRFLVLLMLLLFPALAFADCLCDPARLLPEGSTPVVTENSYLSENVSITITAQRSHYTDVFVADIYLRSLDSFRRVLGNGRWKGGSQNIKELAHDNQGILVMTGDSSTHFSSGLAIVNGEWVRSTKSKDRDLCLLYRNGEMVTLTAREIDYDALQADRENLWQCFLFGPSLLTADGQAKSDFTAAVRPENPRSVIGYYAPGHYCFVQVDGRGTASQLEENRQNRGLTLPELSEFMASLGCTCAYNLDGGQSSVLYFGDDVFSTPYKHGRRLDDAVLICEPDAAAINEKE